MREQGLHIRGWVLLLSGALVVAVTAAMQTNIVEERSLASRNPRSVEPVELEGKQEPFLKKASKFRQKLARLEVTPKPESAKEEQNVTRADFEESVEERREGRLIDKVKEWYEGKKKPEERGETGIIINSHLSSGASYPHFPYYHHHHVPVVQPIIIGGGSTVVTKPMTQLVTHTLVVHESHTHEGKPTQIVIHAPHHHHENPTVVVTHSPSSTYEEHPTLVIVEAPHTHHTKTVTITQAAPSHSKPPHIIIQGTYSTPSHVFIQEPHTHTLVHGHEHHHHQVVHVVKPLESSHDESGGFKMIKDTFYDIGKNIKKKFDEQMTGLSSIFSSQDHAEDHSHVIILQKPDPKPQPVVQTVTLHQHPKVLAGK